MPSQPSRRKKSNPKTPGRAKPAGAKSAGAKRTADDRGGPARRGASGVRARKVAGQDAWELVHPRCARDRQEDLEEVRKMLDAGEVEVAMDECRWLLNGCSDCLEAHRILAEIALGENDLPLARGHFGYAYRLGVQALEHSQVCGPVPYRLPANRTFFESAKGLAWCLRELGKREMAAEVVEQMLRCDASDPLGLQGLLADSPQA